MILEGTLLFQIGEEEDLCRPGEGFIIPPNVAHCGKIETGPCKVLYVFSPPREDYRQRYNAYTESKVLE